jgi:hypothetical protein
MFKIDLVERAAGLERFPKLNPFWVNRFDRSRSHWRPARSRCTVSQALSLTLAAAKESLPSAGYRRVDATLQKTRFNNISRNQRMSSMKTTLFFLILLTNAANVTCPVIAAQPVYAVHEYPDVAIIGVMSNPRVINTRAIKVQIPNTQGGALYLKVSPKTWIIKNNAEAAFADLKTGQHVRVRYIPRGGLAVTLEVLSESREVDSP